MVRVKHAVSTRRRKKRVMKMAKGQFGHRSRRFRQAKKSVVKGLVYAYRDRKAKKRVYRRLWIARINAACRGAGIAYSRFIKGLTAANVEIDRKMLADLAVRSPEGFNKLVQIAKNSVASKPAAKTA
ncbi:MAG: 50S ribosomal protein L20 [Candidatus Omnitrophota bacterium]|nr:50S ribosomal protein L20 [Candidatus Omnitrophota bacterium]MDZ4242502.1 50S ribosomal protein L20 [Candidatus Omnitrophota bacterium]